MGDRARNRIAKFGGTSVGSKESLAALASIVTADPPLATVVSALSGVTDRLIAAAKLAEARDGAWSKALGDLECRHDELATALLASASLGEYRGYLSQTFGELNDVLKGVYLTQELSLRVLDFVLGFGERLSAPLVAAWLSEKGLASTWIDARDLIVTDSNFGAALPRREETEARIKARFAALDALPARPHPVVTGFIASTAEGLSTTLGRGGSDYSASILGAALGVDEIEIWTDVDGIMTADPRKVSKAYPLARLSYQETMELAHFGAKVIHPPTILPAMREGIPISIRNTFNPAFPGTLITKDPAPGPRALKGVASIGRLCLLNLEGGGLVGVMGMASRLFGALARRRVNVILITQASSEHSICWAVAPGDALAAKEAAMGEFALEIEAGLVETPVIEEDLAIVAAVGERMKSTPGISGRLFQALGRNGINVVAIAQGSSELNISVVVSRHDEAKALMAIHDAFFLSDAETVRLFLVGYGLVGRTLVDQILKTRARLLETQAIELRLCGIANSRTMAFDPEGIDLGACGQVLAAGEASSPSGFVARMRAMNGPNSIFVDCTASPDVAAVYQAVLEGATSVVTANKIANSSGLEAWQALHRGASRQGLKFLYETNVGAGLPIIGTLQDLLASGDRVERIEAVLSGTISYIFNNFKGERTFSSLVREAKARGYTEPDPRTDLSALDAARKTLILARELGLGLEIGDVEIEPLLPPECAAAPSVEAFLSSLEAADPWFEGLKEKASAEGRVLRYVSVIEGGKASISLRSLGPDHPFAALDGSDNIISFTTARYAERPLVVKGPGAGGEVTAAGVYADVLRIATYLAR